MKNLYQKFKALYLSATTAISGDKHTITSDSDKGIPTLKAIAMETHHAIALFFKRKQPSPTPEIQSKKEGEISLQRIDSQAKQSLPPPWKLSYAEI